jgi:hypothetical protein
MPKANYMIEFSNTPQPLSEPGNASAEDGLVILDGPNGVAITMTADAARKTGDSLISAADIADRQADNMA